MMSSIVSSVMSIIHSFVSLFLSVAMATGAVTTPSTNNPITAANPDSVQLSFTAIGDTQVNTFLYNYIYMDDVLSDLSNAQTAQDALVIAGDITENSLIPEWDTVYSMLGTYNVTDNYVFATGNHDIRLRTHSQVVDRFTSYYNDFTGENLDKIYYSKEVNGYTFVVIGSDKESLEKQVISDEQLEWIDNTISEATADGKPVFVVCHQPLKDTHGLPGLWNGGVGDSGYIGEQNDELYNILNKYDNLFLISGHLHTGFGQYTYQEVGNIHSVNVPAVGMENKDCDYGGYGLGFTTEVYENEVIFRARDFAKGIYLPEYDITVPLV